MMKAKLLESIGKSLTVEEYSMNVEDGWVHLQDGHEVLLSLPQHQWDKLVSSYEKVTKKVKK